MKLYTITEKGFRTLCKKCGLSNGAFFDALNALKTIGHFNYNATENKNTETDDHTWTFYQKEAKELSTEVSLLSGKRTSKSKAFQMFEEQCKEDWETVIYPKYYN